MLAVEKTCSHCKTALPLERFSPSQRVLPGSWCKPCMNVANQRYKAANPDAWQAAQRKRKLAREWNLTPEAYEALLKAQRGGCAICGAPAPDTPRLNLDVDHDHRCCPGRRSCGKCVRGLLCSGCNMAIGKFRDDVELLKRAVAYLERWKA